MQHVVRGVVVGLCGLALSNFAFANGFSVHVNGGISLADLGSNQNVLLDQASGYSALFETSGQTTLSPFVGLGIGYQVLVINGIISSKICQLLLIWA